jgi:hypothetical protein
MKPRLFEAESGVNDGGDGSADRGGMAYQGSVSRVSVHWEGRSELNYHFDKLDCVGGAVRTAPRAKTQGADPQVGPLSIHASSAMILT